GDYLGFTSALLADRDINIEHTLQALCPGHRFVPLLRTLIVNIRPKTLFPKENSLTKLSALFNRSEHHVRQLSKKASPKISERPSWRLSSQIVVV
ncbi:MAG: hypothetical protein P8Z77_16165, partial [Candidatus Thiodiazotropha sp.]